MNVLWRRDRASGEREVPPGIKSAKRHPRLATSLHTGAAALARVSYSQTRTSKWTTGEGAGNVRAGMIKGGVAHKYIKRQRANAY